MPTVADAKALAHARVTNEALRRYQEALEKKAALAERVKAAAADAVKVCLKHERIYEHQAEAVQEKIAADPVAALELLRDIAKHRNAAELDSIGTPAGSEKTASAKGSPITGAHVSDWDETASGQGYRQKLMGSR